MLFSTTNQQILCYMRTLMFEEELRLIGQPSSFFNLLNKLILGLHVVSVNLSVFGFFLNLI